MKDTETTVPFYSLEKFPGNPKKDIDRIYKSGLKTSLTYFGNIDRLKVWPIPGKKNRYYIVNGNQRLDIIKSINEDLYIAKQFNLELGEDGAPDPKEIKKIRENPDSLPTIQQAEKEALACQINVMIMSRLDREDAILLNATYDRNKGVHDEAKHVIAIEQIKQKNQDIIKRLARPDKGLLNPLPRPEIPFQGSKPTHSDGPVIEPAPFVPANDVEAKFGPPPEQAATPPPQTNKKTLIPIIFSFTQEGYASITSSILKSSSRLYREKKIEEALMQLQFAMGDESIDVDSIIVEIALLTINKHKEIKDQE